MKQPTGRTELIEKEEGEGTRSLMQECDLKDKQVCTCLNR